MHFTEEEAASVKTWVIQRLEDISDADSDVLADYVLALIRSDAPDEEIRQASIENLEDFLKENTVKFVDEIFAKYGPKTQPPAPAAAAAQPAPVQPATAPSAAPFAQPTTYNPAAQAFVPQAVPAPAQDAWSNGQNSRKRTFHEGFQQDNQQGDSQRGGRSFKAPRTRRGGVGRGDRMNGRGRDVAPLPNQFQQGMPGFPPMPPGFPGFDQNDPMAAMMALQSMGFPQMPGLPPMPVPGQPGADQAKSNEPCPFYETNGICYMGAACPYKHGQGPVTIPSGKDEYDPSNASIFDVQGKDSSRGSDRGRGRGRGRGDRGGFSSRGRGGRSEFAHVGPSDDKTNTTVVVENIPEDKYQEQVIRDYFSEFGNISEVNMQGFKKSLAVIKFEDHEAARRAWSSPKAIFDNRFVKVYWHKSHNKPDSNGQAAADQDTPMFDREEFEKQQAEAQKLHEERMKKRKEAEEARLALEKQREELMKKQQEEKAKLLKRLGETSGATGEAAENGSAAAGDENASEQTKALRAQLAALEAEAKSLGIDPEGGAQSFRGRGRGFGGYRGRGRGFDPSRGSYRGSFRGRGAPRGAGRGGVLRLDNRPKRVAISGVDLNSEKDEALRQYLIGVGEYESIEPSPDQPNSLVVTFKERYLAEKLMFGPSEIPSVGKVELSWVPNPPISTTPASTGTFTPAGNKSEDTAMENSGEVDYDVADDEDSWGIGL